jgi:hypothetical protein
MDLRNEDREEGKEEQQSTKKHGKGEKENNKKSKNCQEKRSE